MSYCEHPNGEVVRNNVWYSVRCLRCYQELGLEASPDGAWRVFDQQRKYRQSLNKPPNTPSSRPYERSSSHTTSSSSSSSSSSGYGRHQDGSGLVGLILLIGAAIYMLAALVDAFIKADRTTQKVVLVVVGVIVVCIYIYTVVTAPPPPAVPTTAENTIVLRGILQVGHGGQNGKLERKVHEISVNNPTNADTKKDDKSKLKVTSPIALSEEEFAILKEKNWDCDKQPSEVTKGKGEMEGVSFHKYDCIRPIQPEQKKR